MASRGEPLPIERGPASDSDRRWRSARAAVASVADAVGWQVPADLAAAGGDAAHPVTHTCGPHAMGAAYEASLDDRARSTGIHYTPADVAAGVVGLAGVQGEATRSVWDPSCGGGAILIAAADRLVDAGVDAREIVEDRLWGTDIDPAALAVCEAALVLWATEHGAPDARPRHLAVADPLLTARPGPDRGFDLVVGNPPFQSQLSGPTVRTTEERTALRAHLGDVVGAYTDAAALFLVVASRALAPGGRLSMVLPVSVLAARDAGRARASATDGVDLTGLWVAVEEVFGAAVDVCAAVLHRPPAGGRTDHAPDGGRPPVRRWRGRSFERLADAHPTPRAPQRGPGADRSQLAELSAAPGSPGGARWSALALAAMDVPDVAVRTDGRVGDIAATSAGFRDEFYGLAAHVREAGEDEPGPGLAPLVTSGLIEPGRCHWGERPVHFNRTRYERPVVDLDSLRGAGGRAARWAQRQLVPKVVVATQTRVGEAVVDATGTWVASVPTIAVIAPPEHLWRLAAVVCSPVGTVAALAATAGAARGRLAIKHTVHSVAGLPLPVDGAAWADGAAHLEAADLERFVTAMAAAYAVEDPDLLAEWWFGRLRR